MNLLYPFQSATEVQTTPDGSIHLRDGQGKSLARVPMNTAFELSSKAECYGHGSYGFGPGDGSGFGYGDRYGSGEGGYGYGYGYGDGSGSGKSK